MAITARMAMAGAQIFAACGRIGRATRMNPYAPIFSRIPASRTEPTVGASVCASGSHVWNGHIGTLMANPKKSPAKISTWRSLVIGDVAAWCCNAMMSNVCGMDLKYSARKPSSMKTLPNSVYRKNLMAAYSRFADPHTAIMKYIGTRTSSQKTKNKIRSKAMNVPAIPVSSRSISARKAFGRPGFGRILYV